MEVINNFHMDINEKPREKLLRIENPKKLQTEELISILISHGTQKSNVYEISREITDYLRSNKNNNINIEGLTKIKGIGKTKALQIISALELGRRFYKEDNYNKLSNEDWDFYGLKQSERQYGVHSFHHYTAKFIPQIPAKLIHYLTKGQSIVVDPFMGSGTTLIEAKLLGCHSYGFDTNPLAVKIAKAKTMHINEKKLNEINKFINWIENQKKHQVNDRKLSENVTLFENSQLWFRDDVANKIKIILNEIRTYSPEVQNFIEIGFSDLLKGMSNARMDVIVPTLPKESIYIDKKHYYREVNNLTREIQVYSRLHLKLIKMKQAILEFNKETNNNLICCPILGDAREMDRFIKSCDLVITSPPYWSAVNYEEMHKLSFMLFNLKTEKGKEIGRESSLYIKEIQKVFYQIANILNGYFAVIIGEDTNDKKHEIIFDVALNIGFKHIDSIRRRISNQSSRTKQITNEFIYIFKR